MRPKIPKFHRLKIGNRRPGNCVSAAHYPILWSFLRKRQSTSPPRSNVAILWREVTCGVTALTGKTGSKFCIKCQNLRMFVVECPAQQPADQPRMLRASACSAITFHRITIRCPPPTTSLRQSVNFGTKVGRRIG